MLRMLTMYVHLMSFVNMEVVEKNVLFQNFSWWFLAYKPRIRSWSWFWLQGFYIWWAYFLHAA